MDTKNDNIQPVVSTPLTVFKRSQVHRFSVVCRSLIHSVDPKQQASRKQSQFYFCILKNKKKATDADMISSCLVHAIERVLRYVMTQKCPSHSFQCLLGVSAARVCAVECCASSLCVYLPYSDKLSLPCLLLLTCGLWRLGQHVAEGPPV